MTIDSSFPHPDRVDAITPAWVSEALAGSLPGVDVAGVKVLDQHSGTTGRARLGLEYASGSSGPETVFVKLPPFGEEQRQLVAMTNMGRREAQFYESLAGEVPLRVPRSWFAAHGDEPTQYIMLLEDLEASGCTFPQDVDAHAQDHGRQVIEALARLHAHFWQDERFDGEFSWLPPAMRGALGAQLIDMAREKFGGDFPPVFSELCRLYAGNQEAVCDVLDEGPRTLIHGDIHSGNQFVDGDTIGFYDWAVISRSPSVRDIGIYLCNSCPAELRRAEGEGWVRAYHRALVDAGVDAPDFDTLWLSFRRAVLYGWIAATSTAAVGDRWQPIEIGMAGMKRSTTACADLGTLEAFRDVL